MQTVPAQKGSMRKNYVGSKERLSFRKQRVDILTWLKLQNCIASRINNASHEYKITMMTFLSMNQWNIFVSISVLFFRWDFAQSWSNKMAHLEIILKFSYVAVLERL